MPLRYPPSDNRGRQAPQELDQRVDRGPPYAYHIADGLRKGDLVRYAESWQHVRIGFAVDKLVFRGCSEAITEVREDLSLAPVETAIWVCKALDLCCNPRL